ncbi:MAG: hypothetical protein NUV77_00955 [Thermoguttaceae bacterium]|jgi:hypothetical protein|nr:hypothetical protein [Thermoguttaceae bacterium]
MKRWKKVLKWTAITLGALVAALLAVNAWYVGTSDWRLEKRLAELRSQGEPLSLAELAPGPIPPEQNADTYLRRARADIEAIERGFLHGDNLLLRPPTPDELKAIRAAFDAYPKVVPLLEQAVACPKCDLPLDYTLSPEQFNQALLPEVQALRAVNRVLEARTVLLAHDAKNDEATASAIVLLRLARLFEGGPTFVNYFVANAVRAEGVLGANMAIQTGPVTAKTCAALDAELALHEPMEAFRHTLRTERAYGLDSFRRLPARNAWLFLRGRWNREDLAYLDVIDAFGEVLRADMPCQAAQARLQEAAKQARGRTLVELFTPAAQAAYNAATRTRAMVRSLRVVNALQVCAGDKGVPKLSDLGLPEATTLDPYTGEPLRVKRLSVGWLVYSVGKNLTDDGGKLDDASDDGVGPPPAAQIKE